MSRTKAGFLLTWALGLCCCLAAGAQTDGPQAERVDLQIDIGEATYRLAIEARFRDLPRGQQVEFVSAVGKPSERLLQLARTTRGVVERGEVFSLAQELPLAVTEAGVRTIVIMPQPLLAGRLVASPIGEFTCAVTLPSGKKILSGNLPAKREEALPAGGRRVTYGLQNAWVPVLTLTIIDDQPDFAVTRGPGPEEASRAGEFTDLVANLGERPAANVEVRGFLPFVRDLEIDAGEDGLVSIEPENTGYLYSVAFAEFPARSERRIGYRFRHDPREPDLALGRARVLVDGRTVALSAMPPLVPEDPAERARPSADIDPVRCSASNCGACRGSWGCNRHAPHCKWVAEQNACLPSCGALGGSCQSSAGGTRICLQDRGSSWDCELCCADTRTAVNCLRPDPWGPSGGARFFREYDPGQCQPGNPCDMALIGAGGCWLKLQACWALQEYQNVAGKPYWDFTQDDHLLAVLRYVDRYMTYRVDKDNEACLCPRTGWCFGSPAVKWCGDYWVSWAWFWDWMCDYPVMAKQVSETGYHSAQGACSYCPAAYCGDCEDHAHLRAALLRANGLHSDCVWAAHGPNHVFNHVVYQGAFRIGDYGPQPWLYSSWGAHLADGVFNDHHGGYFSDPHSGTKDPRDFTWNWPRFDNGASQAKQCTVPFHGRNAYRVDYCP